MHANHSFIRIKLTGIGIGPTRCESSALGGYTPACPIWQTHWNEAITVNKRVTRSITVSKAMNDTV